MSISETILTEWKKRDPYLQDIEGFKKFCDQRYPAVHKKCEREAKRQLEYLVKVFSWPIIVAPPSASDPYAVPKWLRGEVTVERMIQVMKGEFDQATDAEACIYIMTCSYVFALDRDWVEIQMYLVRQLAEKRDGEVPDFLKDAKDLTPYQRSLLTDLKEWIRRRQDAALGKR